MSIFESLDGFIWDIFNQNKILSKHGLTAEECEQVLLSKKYVLFDDLAHSSKERRFILIGYSLTNNLLYIVFTIRQKQVRVISARKANRKEADYYEKTFKGPQI